MASVVDDSIQTRFRTAIEELARGSGKEIDLPLDSDGRSVLQTACQAGIDQQFLARAVSEVLGIDFLPVPSDRPASASFVSRIPIGYARQHCLLGLQEIDGKIPVAVGDWNSHCQLDAICRILGRPVEPVLAPPEEILSAINLAYQQRSGQAQALIESLEEPEISLKASSNGFGRSATVVEKKVDLFGPEGREDLLDYAGRAPVVKLVNLVLFEAVEQAASDVHFQPYEDRFVVRIRIDGVLFDAFEIPRERQEEVVSRIKIVGRMNIAEKRLPQDGRASVQIGDRLIDLRIASLPTSYGERIVVRLLDKSARLYTLEGLGMDSVTLSMFRQIIGIEHGLVLVTGPTGAGKSTTLYAALQELDTKERNVLTLEDPIEYELEGISQTQVNYKKGLTFASGLRNVLRQDPDIIMVGEIRDRETAEMAIQSALTGHLVFSTLHTNDAASAVTRLLDLGTESYLVASSLRGVLAQRLVRKVCRECAQSHPPAEKELRRLDWDPARTDVSLVCRGIGCKRCRRTGYTGRVGIFELLVVNEAIRQRIHHDSIASEIKKAAISEADMKVLRKDGIAKILAGVTTVEEVARVTS